VFYLLLLLLTGGLVISSPHSITYTLKSRSLRLSSSSSLRLALSAQATSSLSRMTRVVQWRVLVLVFVFFSQQRRVLLQHEVSE
jgi:DNA-binding IclR family transcriptional regulator